ncbi:alpha/beta hydrolase domain-containing protein [Sphaerisporangium sp. TRM90804]|uniref:alpha/beta hydrolase domain-containing protein n=1 Tax=Sphaerisporangium sp. TRM90804 TaxID=3031113 RepID=UPI00244C8414|nr:alpha/beta hydrolase domain-containing protein [Sphaerisporangium sp. TRM90804]MDH2426845.1 alpha/beta hydrolase domain-containing protein [Sphaerisporangium sp. TRM90804]
MTTARVMVAGVVVAGLAAAPAHADARRSAPAPVSAPAVEGPLPGSVPGDPSSPDVRDTYPWLSAGGDLAARGYVEQEFLLSGTADAYDTTGRPLASDVPYRTRIIVRRPALQAAFNGTVLAEWQNVSAGFDLDALWSPDQITRAGYAWVGVSAQRVGVDQLRGWSPARYGGLDVTGGGRFTADELSYDIFSQAAKAVRARGGKAPLGRSTARTVLAVGASQSAGRMTVYYDAVLPRIESVFDGFATIVGTAPTRAGAEPVFQVLSETDVRSPARPPDRDRFRRWEVAGAAHSGWAGQEYRRPLLTRDLGQAPEYACDQPPFSRVPLHHVLAAAYDHLTRWAERGVAPPAAPPLLFNPDGTKARDELGLALGGIRLSQVAAPTALNNGDNSGDLFCRLFGTHIPFDQARLDQLYRHRALYVAAVAAADAHNLRQGYLLAPDAAQNLKDATGVEVGHRAEIASPARRTTP